MSTAELFLVRLAMGAGQVTAKTILVSILF